MNSPTLKSKNIELRTEFMAYCAANPQLRFWQALRSWSGFNFVLVTDDVENINMKRVQDTFYWEGKNG